MKYYIILFIGVVAILSCSLSTKNTVDAVNISKDSAISNHKKNENMKLGAFSISLSVKDLKTSKLFYENLGFKVSGGDMKNNYLIMKNGNSLIGIFQDMFEGNIITFNPGWDENGTNVESFDDVRAIQQHLKSKDVALVTEADEETTGPASFMVKDPDGNLILIDQHR